MRIAAEYLTEDRLSALARGDQNKVFENNFVDQRAIFAALRVSDQADHRPKCRRRRESLTCAELRTETDEAVEMQRRSTRHACLL